MGVVLHATPPTPSPEATGEENELNADRFYITTPIYYVNDKPHIGHSYTTILADVLARYQRFLGVPTHFLTGTDEHGQKVQQAAEKAGITPQEQADRTVVRFQDLWKKLGMTHDDFIRTTEERHTRVVQDILQDLHDRDEIYRAEYDGWYCVPDERFFTEKDLVDGNCPECGRAVEKIREANYFFRMGRYQEWLVSYIQENPGFIQPDYRRNETLGFLRRPLNDLCISRPKTRLTWGIELPFDHDYVTYVWFDALVNYISAVGYLRDDNRFTQWWPASCHLIGKDILTTHTVYWPTMLKALGLPMPEMIFAHGWWLSGANKMSKSLGNVVNPMDMADRYGVDAFRYFLMAEMVLGQDASFTEDAFVRRYNSDLANDLGNLLNRVLNMTGRYCGGILPAPEACAPPGEAEIELRAAVEAAVQGMREAIPAMKLHEGLQQVMTAVRATNRYLETRAPWSLAKQEDKAPLHTVLRSAAESLRACAGLLQPVMPEKMTQLRALLGHPEGVEPCVAELDAWNQLPAEAHVGAAAVLFPRIVADSEPESAAPSGSADKAVKAAPGGPRPAKGTPAEKAPATATAGDDSGAGLITYEDFTRVQLRAARVTAAEAVEGAKKLLKLQVDVGGEQRQVVAGIAQHYAPQALVGRTLVLVANLRPAVIRGVESHGMLLAASTTDRVRLVTIDGEIDSGAVVK